MHHTPCNSRVWSQGLKLAESPCRAGHGQGDRIVWRGVAGLHYLLCAQWMFPFWAGFVFDSGGVGPGGGKGGRRAFCLLVSLHVVLHSDEDIFPWILGYFSSV